jgi:hypothetical protein
MRSPLPVARLACVIIAVLAAGVLGSCSESSTYPLDETASPTPAGGSGDAASVDQPSPGVELEVNDPRIDEASGLARSHRYPGVLYLHNDKASSEVFAVDQSGTRAVLRLDVPMSIDWEDIASTPDGRVWVGDIGDNDENRTSISVVVFEEPDILTSETLPTTTFRLRYPDGPHNAEALLVQPSTDRVFVVSKEAEGAQIYAAPEKLTSTGVNTLRAVSPAPETVTSGDFAPDGRTFVLRNYGRAFYYSRLGAEPVVQRLPKQEQGEGITFDQDGSHVLLDSEGEGTPILRVPVPDGI